MCWCSSSYEGNLLKGLKILLDLLEPHGVVKARFV